MVTVVRPGVTPGAQRHDRLGRVAVDAYRARRQSPHSWSSPIGLWSPNVTLTPEASLAWKDRGPDPAAPAGRPPGARSAIPARRPTGPATTVWRGSIQRSTTGPSPRATGPPGTTSTPGARPFRPGQSPPQPTMCAATHWVALPLRARRSMGRACRGASYVQRREILRGNSTRHPLRTLAGSNGIEWDEAHRTCQRSRSALRSPPQPHATR